MSEFIYKTKQLLPPFAKRLLKRQVRPFKRTYRSLKRRTARPVTKKELVNGLRAMGLESGDVVMVHSSLSKLGFVIDGPQAVVKALLEVVGYNGMIVMPAYPFAGSNLEFLATNPLFDSQKTPSQMGKITEVFRLWPGAYRSIHPTHSVSAIGHHARNLIMDHFRSITPFGSQTPFRRLLDKNTWILGMGVDLGPMTFYHVFEDMVDEFPLPIYHPKVQRARILVEGVEHEVWTKVHDPKIASFRIDQDMKIRALITEKLLEWGFLRQGMIGEGLSYIIRSRHLITALERMLSIGITIYNTERMYIEGWELPDGLSIKLQ